MGQHRLSLSEIYWRFFLYHSHLFLFSLFVSDRYSVIMKYHNIYRKFHNNIVYKAPYFYSITYTRNDFTDTHGIEKLLGKS